jgi:hypothetical protein
MARAPNFDKPAREAAARAFGTDPKRIFIEVDKVNVGHDGNPIVVVNWQESMTASSATRAAVKEAVRAVLPESCRHYHVSVI